MIAEGVRSAAEKEKLIQLDIDGLTGLGIETFAINEAHCYFTCALVVSIALNVLIVVIIQQIHALPLSTQFSSRQ